LFEKVFNHKAFTGRSGTFFAYEGLGSIYWHMVSKLLLAVQETYVAATHQKADEAIVKRIATHFHAIKKGIGVHKSTALYGAFPTDPYSHTPMGKGAQQPGMTGQVKEDILSRFGELGVFVQEGKIGFNPLLLHKKEFLQTEKQVNIINSNGENQIVVLKKNSLLFTVCQVPVIYELGERTGLTVKFKNGSERTTADSLLNEQETELLFARSAEIISIRVFIKPSVLLN
jgi:hypothetical protein